MKLKEIAVNAKKALPKVLPFLGMALSVGGSLISGIANKKAQNDAIDKAVEKKVNEIFAGK